MESDDYENVADTIRWFIGNEESNEVRVMDMRGREYLLENLVKEIYIVKYKRAIL